MDGWQMKVMLRREDTEDKQTSTRDVVYSICTRALLILRSCRVSIYTQNTRELLTNLIFFASFNAFHFNRKRKWTSTFISTPNV